MTIHIDLYRSAMALPKTGPETIFTMKFETWVEALKWYNATGLRTSRVADVEGSDSMRQVLTDGVNGDNTYIGHEIELVNADGSFSKYGLSIEGNEDFEVKGLTAGEMITLRTLLGKFLTVARDVKDENPSGLVEHVELTYAFVNAAIIHGDTPVDPGD